MKRKMVAMLMACVVAMSVGPVSYASRGSGKFMGGAASSGSSSENDEYGAGQYKVGTDIPAGEYVIFAKSGLGYFCVSSDSNGNDIIVNENFDYNSILTVSEGTYLELSRCYAVPIDKVSTSDMDFSGTGMFKVGTHIPAGEYLLDADSGKSAYYCIYNSSTQQNIVSNNNFEGSQYVTVTDGQYLVLDRCHFDTTPGKVTVTYSDKDTVKKVQEALNAAGYECGTADGIAGDKTKQAISKYQADHNLTESGVIDDDLLNALNNGETSSQSVSDESMGVSLSKFVERYNEAIDVYNILAEKSNYPKAVKITESDLQGTDSFVPENNLSLCVNPNTNHKDPVGIINLFAEDKSSINSTLMFAESTAMMYALDTSMEGLVDSTKVLTRLLDGESEISQNGITYDLYSIGSTFVIKASYDGFEIIKE